jgi:hypothetical protein
MTNSKNSAALNPSPSRKTCFTAKRPAPVVDWKLWIANVTPRARM